MKKNLIALAVAGALVAPMTAAANVTVFGTIQQEVVSYERTQNSGAAKTSRMGVIDGLSGGWNADNGSGPSTIGIRATQDLGNGMKATAVASFNATQRNTVGNNNVLGHRDMYVNLDTGTSGTIWLGRFTTPYATAGKDALNGTFMQARGNGGMIGTNGSLGNGGHLDNLVGYSNKFGPVSIVGGIVMDEQDSGGANSANHGYAVRAEMSLADVGVWVAATNANKYGAAAGDNSKNNATKIGADYKFGDFRVMGQFESLQIANAAGTDTTKMDHMLLQGSYTMGANTIVLSVGQGDSKLASNADITYTAIGVRHAFSRQVSVHGGYRATEVKNSTGNVDGTKDSVIGAGLRVGF